MISDLEQFETALRELDPVMRKHFGSVEGWSPDEVDQIEAEVGVRLPDTYRAFLEYYGKSVGPYLDLSVTAEALKGHDVIAELLEFNNIDYRPSDPWFLVFNIQGYDIGWVEQRPDGDVFLTFCEGEGMEAPQPTPYTLEDYIIDFLKEEIEITRREMGVDWK